MKSIMLAGAMLLSFTYSFATTWTVSNNPDRPAQFTTIQEAVDEALPGDTILISSGTYAGMTSFKNLVIYGEDQSEGGVFVQNGGFNFTRFNEEVSASGSRVYNVSFPSSWSFTVRGDYANFSPGSRTMSDIIFERCVFSGFADLSFRIYDGISDITIRNCVLSNNGSISFQDGSGSNLSNFVLTNCVFGGTARIDWNLNSVEGNVVVRNCLFLNSAAASFDISELVIENCIFYNRPPSGCSTCTFNNNFTYLTEGNSLPYGNNVGSGNITSEDPFIPVFTDYPQLGANWSLAHDYSLADGSPCIDTGTNGSDIGINDGNAPITNIPTFPKIPTVTDLTIPVSSVPVGGTLQINVTAESR